MKTLAVLIGLLLSAGSALAEGYAPGDTLAPLELPDQHGVARKLDESIRRVVFTREMKGGRIAKAALEEDGPGLLQRASALYVTDMSRMPRLVRSLFAMPSLRRRTYPILLDLKGETTAKLPTEEGRVTVLSLEALRVTEVRFLEKPEEIREALGH
jgi:hypothetical protein